MWKRKCTKGALNNFNVWTKNNAIQMTSNDLQILVDFHAEANSKT